MTTKIRVLRRIGYSAAALALVVAVAVPVFRPGQASAAQLASRSITLSDSGVSGGSITSGVGSGTGVAYKVGFTTSAAASSLIIDFCSTDPIIGDTCTAPAAMNAASATLTGITGNITTAGWVTTGTGATQIKLAKGSGSAATAGAQVFSLSGITNTSANGSFYARIYTYSDATFGSTGTAYSSPTSPGSYVDYGGIALSTNQIIAITARVQEQLTFCVSGSIQTGWASHDCTDPNAAVVPAITLGHGAPTKILDSTAVDTAPVYSQLSTNATHGAAIALRNSNTVCGGLSADGGATCAIPATGATAATIVAGTAAFGMNAPASTDDTSGTGSMTINATYGTAAKYGMDNTTAGANVETTYGSSVATTATPVYRVDDAYTFAATASLTTPAGIYTANMDMIATGTF